MYSYIINNISLSINASFKEAFSIAGKRLRTLGASIDNAAFKVYKRSIDARKRSELKFVYSVSAVLEHPIRPERLASCSDVKPLSEERPSFIPCKNNDISVAVVGAGPCGLFCALALCENGYKVTLIERGDGVEQRTAKVERFISDRILDPSSNIQFGAGGAGTFSDGKLVTRINDPYCSYVLDRFVEFGAPKEILYLAKPHVGTDVLREVVTSLLDRLKELGCTVMMNTTVTDIVRSFGRVRALKTDKGDICCTHAVLAIGHSARDTYESLIGYGMDIEAKPFSVGMRIEHSVQSIDRGLFGDLAGHPALGHGEYNLSYDTKGRGVYTFCMCPGGEVVAAASELGGVCVNGMSRHARDGKNSNSAVVCSVFPTDHGGTPISGIDFQRRIERGAFLCGGGDYSAPITTVGSFLDGSPLKAPYDVMPTYMDGKGVTLCKPEDYLPDFVTGAIRNAILSFDRRLPGFAHHGALLTGAETRTSAPLRILRDNGTRLATGYSNLYPAGEGAGYAGGITSAAVDGLRTATAIMEAVNSL